MTRASMAPGPALPPRLRRWSPAVAATAVVTLAVLAVRYRDTDDYGRVDDRAQLTVDAVAAERRELLGFATSIGDPLPVVIIAFALAGLCWWFRQPRLAAVAVVGTGVTGLATIALKPLVGRTMDGGAWAFPSGHTAAATALGLATGLLVVAVRRSDGWAAAGWLAATALVTGGGMGVFLVAARIHYATDTVGGFCAAVAATLTVALLVDALSTRVSGLQGDVPPARDG